MTHQGVMLDPYRLDEWAAKVGMRPNALMQFEAWGKGVPTVRLAKVRSLGLRYHVTTWEPWTGTCPGWPPTA